MRIYTDEHRAAYERNWARKFWARIDRSGGLAECWPWQEPTFMDEAAAWEIWLEDLAEDEAEATAAFGREEIEMADAMPRLSGASGALVPRGWAEVVNG